MATRQPLSFSDLLRHLRLEAGLSQDELAEKARLSRNGVSEIERGRKRPYKDTVSRLADGLGLAGAERAFFEAAARARPSPTIPVSGVSGLSGVPGLPAPSLGPLPINTSNHHRSAVLPRERAPLVDRAPELRLIERHLTSPQLYEGEQRGAALLIFAGEPGIGKSRLLREGSQRASASGWVALSGGCARRGGQEPFEPFVGLLARAIAATAPAERRHHLAGCGWLTRLLPELAETMPSPGPAWAPRPEQERRLMFAAVRHYLANIAGPAGTLLVLDDLQWAQADALDLLSYLVGEPAAPNSTLIRVIAAYRSTEVRPGDPLIRVLDDLNAAGSVSESPLGPLSALGASAMLDGLLSDARLGDDAQENAPEDAQHPDTLWGSDAPVVIVPADVRQEVLLRAEGVPFYLVSTARALLTDEQHGEGSWRVPWSAAQSVRARMAAVPERARELLGVAAVIGRTVPASLLLTLAVRSDARSDEDDVLAALEATHVARLLVEHGADYQFPHDLIRDVVLADLSSARSRALHRRVAEALARLPDVRRKRHLAEIADHFLEAGEQAQALPYLLSAGDQAMDVHAHAEAKTRYHTALAAAEEEGDDRQEAASRLRLGGVLIIGAPERAEGMGLLREVSDYFATTGEIREQAKALVQIGHAAGWQDTPQVGIDLLNRWLEPLTEAGLPPAERARLLLAEAHLYQISGRHDEVLRCAELAKALSVAAGALDLQAASEMRISTSLLMMGQNRRGRRVLEEALPLIEAHGDLRTLAHTWNNLSVAAETQEGDFVLGREYAERALAAAVRLGDPALVAFMVGRVGTNAYSRGDWATARTRWEEALELNREAGTPSSTGWLFLKVGRLYLAMGQTEQGRRYLGDGLEYAERLDEPQMLQVGHCALGEWELLHGEPRAAVRRLEPLRERWEGRVEISFLLLHLAWTYLVLGDVSAADRVISEVIEEGREQGSELVAAEALPIKGRVLLASGCRTEAQAAIDEGLRLSEAMGNRYDVVKALYAYGSLHLECDELALARARYRRALSICRELGERLYAARMERALPTVSAGGEPS